MMWLYQKFLGLLLVMTLAVSVNAQAPEVVDPALIEDAITELEMVPPLLFPFMPGLITLIRTKSGAKQIKCIPGLVAEFGTFGAALPNNPAAPRFTCDTGNCIYIDARICKPKPPNPGMLKVQVVHFAFTLLHETMHCYQKISNHEDKKERAEAEIPVHVFEYWATCLYGPVADPFVQRYINNRKLAQRSGHIPTYWRIINC